MPSDCQGVMLHAYIESYPGIGVTACVIKLPLCIFVGSAGNMHAMEHQAHA